MQVTNVNGFVYLYKKIRQANLPSFNVEKNANKKRTFTQILQQFAKE